MFKWILCLSFFCAQFCLEAETLYISLGSNCVPAFCLTDCKLRTAAYPFDWIISSFDGLYATLESDFCYFFKDLELLPDSTGVTDYYGHQFIHDWRIQTHSSVDLTEVDWVPNNLILGDWQEAVPMIMQKYQRRIDRFRRVLNGENNVVFIRYGDITKSKAINLRNLIEKNYPNLNFVLLAVKLDEKFEKPWKIPKIKNYSIVHNDTEKWFQALFAATLELEKI